MISLQELVEIVGNAGVVPDMAKFDPEKTFKQNGIDSLDVYTVLLAVEERLGVKFSEDEAATIQSVSALFRQLLSRQP